MSPEMKIWLTIFAWLVGLAILGFIIWLIDLLLRSFISWCEDNSGALIFLAILGFFAYGGYLWVRDNFSEQEIKFFIKSMGWVFGCFMILILFYSVIHCAESRNLDRLLPPENREIREEIKELVASQKKLKEDADAVEKRSWR